jgi:hypothetical protein
MSFLSYEQVDVSTEVLGEEDLTIPAEATGAMLQADTQDVRYMMDGSTSPTESTGMILQNGLAPEQFGIEDILKIRFIRGAATDAVLNIHYFSG